jgi:hypothetical protein
MRRHLEDVTPRTVILLPDGRVGWYSHREFDEYDQVVGVAESGDDRVALALETVVDVVYCDRQAQETLYALLLAGDKAHNALSRRPGGVWYEFDAPEAWVRAGPVALRICRAPDGGLLVGAYAAGDVTGDADAREALPLRSFHILEGEV